MIETHAICDRPRSPRELAQSRVLTCRLRAANAELHARYVGRALGAWGPEHILARKVAADARAELVRALDAALDLDAGVPVERRS